MRFLLVKGIILLTLHFYQMREYQDAPANVGKIRNFSLPRRARAQEKLYAPL